MSPVRAARLRWKIVLGIVSLVLAVTAAELVAASLLKNQVLVSPDAAHTIVAGEPHRGSHARF